MATYAVILVHTTSAAMRSEAVLHRAGIDVKLIPVPRNLSSDCGLAVRIPDSDRQRALECLAKEHVEIAGDYDL